MPSNRVPTIPMRLHTRSLEIKRRRDKRASNLMHVFQDLRIVKSFSNGVLKVVKLVFGVEGWGFGV